MPEMNNFIQVPFRVDGWNSNALLKELNEAGFETQITRRHFSAGSTGGDFFNLALELAPYAFGLLSSVLVAYVTRGKKVKISFKDGRVTELETNYCSVKEVTKLLESIESVRQIDVSNN
ncbi:hypothetical protein [Serratia marcescens]|uniref:Uncharacterized protein n=1 Tax=Serratia marcescens TaxID=615 RepID=A0A380A011_SERMA|nr:hypothetical protein [Serratia marcescens]KFD11610.1 hypothetical protein GSMA_03831 [Serratia marcescens subsp. marcescens ATCC 13880]KFL01672.1 hypothetical protein DP21_3523 [Serratia marcescens]MCC3249414.1 hypothetical protein [Serratia marcescens]PNU46168.1 hypothetical protein C2M02_02780 [Serratia marcescens subsp. marcescens ATCC 13880]QDL85552.1 hypothetical protein FG183_09595 [Serratia marcescens subsp. marcescens ATCC 13880]